MESVSKTMGSKWQLYVICDNKAINCDKSVKIANLLPSAANLLSATFEEIHFNYLHLETRQNLIDLKEKFWNSFTNIDLVDIQLQKDSHALQPWFYTILTRRNLGGNQLSCKEVRAHRSRLTHIDCNMLEICLRL